MKFEAPTALPAERRATLTRRRVLEAAVELADRHGIESVSMRRLGQELGVEAMSLYTHVRSKEDLLDGMVEVVIGQIRTRRAPGGWKPTLRNAILAARRVMLRHPWAPPIIETRVLPGPSGLQHFDTVMGILRDAGFSIGMTHHALHLLGSRIFGFTQDLFNDSPDMDEAAAAAAAAQRAAYPRGAEMAVAVSHEGGLGGCDDDVEFGFALDVMLDGLERMKDVD